MTMTTRTLDVDGDGNSESDDLVVLKSDGARIGRWIG
jgi:hypothetical protein